MTKVAAATSKSAQELLRYQQNNGYLNDVRLESFGFFLDNYVIYGGDLTFDTVDVYKVLLSESIISLNDQLWRAFIKEFRITKYNSTYYVGFLHEKGYVIGETEPAENYMRLWTIPVDANGVIGVPIDHRNLYGYLKFKAKYDGVYLNVDEVRQAIDNANSAADKANEAASDIQGAVDEAKRASNQANEAVIKTEAVLESVSSSLSQLDNSIEDANKAIGESNTATANAKQAAQDAITAKDNLSNAVTEKINQADTAIKNANDAAGAANQASEAIKGWGNKRQWNKEQYYEKNNIVTHNGSAWQALRANKGIVPVEGEDWTCLAQKGVDGTGAVSSVNGNFPDENGNVELDIQQGTVQKINGKNPDNSGEVTLVASDLGEMSGDQLTNESVSFAKLAHDVRDAIKKAGGNSFFFPYALTATLENQKTWDLPVNSFDATTDSLLVFHNGGILENESWNITGDAGTAYTLEIPDNPIIKIEDNNVLIMVLKNAPSQVPESISGTLLTPGSIGLEKLGQGVQDAINNAGGKIEIVNDLTTGGADKAASAETVKILKNQVDGTGGAIKNLEQTISQNQEVVTEHLTQMSTTEKAGHVMLVNDLTIGGANKAASAETVKILKTETISLKQETDKKVEINKFHTSRILNNMGQQQFTKMFYPTFTSNTITEVAELQIPASVALQGSIELNLTSGYWNSNAVGTAKVMIHLSLSADGTVNFQEINFITMTPQFANNFYINTVTYVPASKVYVLNIHKRLSNNPLQIEMTVRTSGKNFTKEEIDLFTMSVWNVGSVGSYPIQQSIFTHVGNSKEGLAVAITGKGKQTSKDDTFATMIANINDIPTGYDVQIVTATPSAGQYAFFRTTGTGTINLNYVDVPVTDSSNVLLMYGINATNSSGGGFFTYNANSEYNGTAQGVVKTASFNHTSDNTTAVRNLIGLKLSATSMRIPIPVVTGSYAIFVVSRK